MSNVFEHVAKLKAAQEAYEVQRKLPWDWDALKRLDGLVHVAEAELAAAKNEPFARPVSLGFEFCSDGVRLLQSAEETFLIMGTFARQDGEITGRQFRVLRMLRCEWTTFGYPNDEAMEGHPLHGRGLDTLEVCEVFNSPWIARMHAQNRVGFPDSDMLPTRHFIFSFLDNTFECLCAGWEVVFSSPDFQTAFAHTASLLSRK